MAFKDPIDEEADAAEASLVGKRSSELAERISKAREGEAEEIEVQEPDDDEEEEKAAKSRSEKRSERGRDRVSLRERTAAAEARTELLREQLETERSQRTQTRTHDAQPNNNEVARLERNYEAVLAQQKTLFNEYQRAQSLTPAQEAEYERRAAVLDYQKTNALVELRDANNAPQRAREEHKRLMSARAPDVYANLTALAYAAGEYQKRLAMGEADTLELHDAACEEARQVILGKRPPPDQAQRARATGMGSGARAPVGAGAPVKLSMPKGSPIYKIAVAMYPNDEPGVACQKWANKHGKAFNERVKARA